MIPRSIQDKIDNFASRFTLFFVVLIFVALCYYLYMQHKNNKVMMNYYAMNILSTSKESGIAVDNTLVDRALKGDTINDLVTKVNPFNNTPSV